MSSFGRALGGAPCAAAAAACFLLAGCAAVTTAEGRRLGIASAEFRAYAEQVFRAQNEVATELAFALEEHSDAPALMAAEDELLAACAQLNALAAARRDERRTSTAERVSAARSAPGCERAANAARAALERPE